MKDTVIKVTDIVMGLTVNIIMALGVSAYDAGGGWFAIVGAVILASVVAGFWSVLSRINDSLKSLVKIQDAIYNKLNKDE